MKRTDYILRPRSGAWNAHPDAHSPECRLLGFDMTVEYDGKRLGGHNVQAVLGAADQPRRGLNADVAFTLDSDWWITLRNQFAHAPCVAIEILESASHGLTLITAEATDARGTAAEAVTRKLFSSAFEGAGPAYWL
jgi:hypothetical protein